MPSKSKHVFLTCLLFAASALAFVSKADNNSNIGTASSTYYRGFVSASFMAPLNDCGYNDEIGANILTSHGVQVNSYLFVGGGTGVVFNDEITVPLFVDVRSEFPNLFNTTKVTPFLDLKTGISFGNDTGFYHNESAGCRFRVGKHGNGINLAIGYSYQPHYSDFELSVAFDF